MNLSHTVETDDGKVTLRLGDGDTIFDLIAHGSNGQLVAVHLGTVEGQQCLADAGAVRVAFGTGGAAERILTTLDGVESTDQPEGEITFVVPARAATSTMTVDNGAGARTTLTLNVAAHDDLTVGLNKILSQI